MKNKLILEPKFTNLTHTRIDIVNTQYNIMSLLNQSNLNETSFENKTTKNTASKRSRKHLKKGKGSSFKIFVGGFPVEFDENDLFDYMGTFGEVIEAKLHTKKNGQSKGFGFVSFEKKNAAKKAL